MWSVATSVVASLNGSRLGCRGTCGPHQPVEEQTPRPGWALCWAHPDGAWEHTELEHVDVPAAGITETLWLQPAPSLGTTAFPRSWHLLSARWFSPLVSFFWKELVGVGRKEKCCGENPQRVWVQGGAGP